MGSGPKTNSRPECFGDLSKVFPKQHDGLREVSAKCWDCRLRVECLRQAATQGKQGQQLEEERQMREDTDGVGGFLKRWSRRKMDSGREDKG